MSQREKVPKSKKKNLMSIMIVTESVTKASKDSKVGIAFTQSKKTPLIIKVIKEDGLFAASSIREGMYVLEVNGQIVHGKSADESISILRDAEGECTVTAIAGLGASAVKQTKESKIGIKLGQKQDMKDILITHINEDGLFGTSKLKVGQKVLAINGQTCPNDVKQAIDILRQASGRISIVVDKTIHEIGSRSVSSTPAGTIGVANGTIPEQAPPAEKAHVTTSGTVLTGTVQKGSVDIKVGISFSQTPRLPLSIANVVPGGLFDSTELETGMFVLEVNGMNVDGKLSQDAVRLLRDAGGDASVKAIRASGASVLKTEKDTKTGISFKKGKDAVIIAKAGGLFAGTDLKRGQKLYSVNGVAIESDDVKLAASMIRDAMGKVSLLAVDRTEAETKADNEVAAQVFAAAQADRKAKISESLPNGVLVTGTIEKKSANDQVGISLTQTESTPLCISTIVPGCLFDKTDLQPGMWILSINGENVHGKSAAEAIKPLRENQGTLSITALTGTAASVTKTSKEAKVGISLKREGDIVVVHKSAGLFKDSNLHVGERVYAINGEVIGGDLSQAISLIRSAVGKISVVTGPHTSAPNIPPPLAATSDIAVGKEKVRFMKFPSRTPNTYLNIFLYLIHVHFCFVESTSQGSPGRCVHENDGDSSILEQFGIKTFFRVERRRIYFGITLCRVLLGNIYISVSIQVGG